MFSPNIFERGNFFTSANYRLLMMLVEGLVDLSLLPNGQKISVGPEQWVACGVDGEHLQCGRKIVFLIMIKVLTKYNFCFKSFLNPYIEPFKNAIPKTSQ